MRGTAVITTGLADQANKIPRSAPREPIPAISNIATSPAGIVLLGF
jgi:hypothetical protein